MKGGGINVNTKKEKLPESFKSDTEAGEFWDRHSAMDYPDELEEVEMDHQLGQWNITLGLGKIVSTDPIQMLKGKVDLSVKYKVFRIDSQTGELVSVKMREN